MRALEIAVCGAGIGGLAAAACLANAGHAVTLFERFDTPQPLGAGLMLQPTGLAALAHLGLKERIEILGRRISGIDGHTASGRPIFNISYAALDPTLYAIGIHRGALFQCLYDAARAAPIRFETNVTIGDSTIAHDKRIVSDTTGRSRGAFDLIIDGTGLTSELRRKFADTRFERVNSYGAVWGVVDEPAGHGADQRLAQVYDRASVMIGLLPIGRLPIASGNKTAVFWSLRTADLAAWQAHPFAEWQDRVCRLWPAAAPFISQFRSHTDLTPARYADLRIAKPIGTRIAFLGDAARAASPQLGQGANLALIDACCLAQCLDQNASVETALAHYARLRRAHTRFYGYASRILTPFFQSDSKMAPQVRDAIFDPMSKIPYLRNEMIRTLSGLKTGIFTHAAPSDFLDIRR